MMRSRNRFRASTDFLPEQVARLRAVALHHLLRSSPPDSFFPRGPASGGDGPASERKSEGPASGREGPASGAEELLRIVKSLPASGVPRADVAGRANVAHVRQSRPDIGLGFEAKDVGTFKAVPSFLGRGYCDQQFCEPGSVFAPMLTDLRHTPRMST